MRILIFILALMSAFFVPKSFSALPDLSDLKRPEVTLSPFTGCATSEGNIVHKEPGDIPSTVMVQICGTVLIDKFAADSTSGICPAGQPRIEYTGTYARMTQSLYKAWYWDDGGFGGCSNDGKNNVILYARTIPDEETEVCPPQNAPEYDIPITQHGQKFCAKELDPEDCPAGYHSKGTSAQLGSSECVPKDCPASGSSESLFSSPNIGGVPFDGSGLYCNDGCAYTVDESQISLSKYAIGVSQGIACGDKPYDNKKLAEQADADQCSVVSDNNVNVLKCPDYSQPEPEENPIDNDESKVDDTETPEKPKETCADGDASCNIKNVETEIENSTNRQIDNDNELHNKKIEADEKNAKAFLNVMESIDTAILLQTSQDERLHALTIGKFNELVDAVNGIEAGGGGGGGGNGTGNGNIGGQDCEGTIEECAGIGSGDGVELPQETRNLEQYAQKYNNWLPAAELPPEKCITLTNGKSLCFSFQYFILFFQAISGLIVISSLIHSASIIVRSV